MQISDKSVILVAKALAHSRLYLAIVLLLQYLNPSQAPQAIQQILRGGKALRRLYEVQDKLIPVIDPTQLGLLVRYCPRRSESDYYTVYQLYTDEEHVVDVAYPPLRLKDKCNLCVYYNKFIRTPIPVDNFTTGRIEQYFDARLKANVIQTKKEVDPSDKHRYAASLIATSACIASPRQSIGWRNLIRRGWAFAVALRYEEIFKAFKHSYEQSSTNNVYRIRSKTIINMIKNGSYAGVVGFFPRGMIRGRPLIVRFRVKRSPLEVASYIAPTASAPGIFCNDSGDCLMFARAPPDSMEEFMSRLRGRGLVSSYQVNVIRAAKHTSLAWEMYNPLDGRWCRALEPRGLKACHEKGIVYWSKAGIILFIKAALQDRDEGAWRQYMDSMEFLGGA